MHGIFNRFSAYITALILTMVSLTCPVFAAANPSTGDNNQVVLMTVLLVASAVIIITLVVLSAMKKKNGKK